MKLYVVQDVKSKAYLTHDRLRGAFTHNKSMARRFGLADAQRTLEFYSGCEIVPVEEISQDKLGTVR